MSLTLDEELPQKEENPILNSNNMLKTLKYIERKS